MRGSRSHVGLVDSLLAQLTFGGAPKRSLAPLEAVRERGLRRTLLAGADQPKTAVSTQGVEPWTSGLRFVHLAPLL